MASFLQSYYFWIIDTLISLFLLILPDFFLNFFIRAGLADRLVEESKNKFSVDDKTFLDHMDSLLEKEKKIAVDSEAAKEQHYEVPTDFFLSCLGPCLKYSCCLYTQNPLNYLEDASTKQPNFPFDPKITLFDAELNALNVYAALLNFSKLPNGTKVLDMGMGWGSAALYFASKFRHLNFTGISHSRTQAIYINNEAKKRGIENLTVITENVNNLEAAFAPNSFDAVYSIECMEHIRGVRSLYRSLQKIIKPNGPLLVHTFVNAKYNYLFDDQSWMGRNFFTGGMMPSQTLYLTVAKEIGMEALRSFAWNGNHYALTSKHWLENMRKNMVRGIISLGNGNILSGILQFQRWRLFYLAVVECFAYDKGNEWFVDVKLFKNTK